MTFLVLSVVVALSLSALCSLMEATLLSLTPSQVAEIADSRPKVGRTWQSFKAQIDRPISVILIINTAAHTIGATIAGAEFDNLFGGKWIWVFSLIFTGVMLQFTEILPKTLGVQHNRRIAILIARPLQVLVVLLHPVIQVVRWINRPFERQPHNGTSVATPEEIAALAGLARLSRQITTHQERIIKGGSRLSRARVQDVMIPIEQVSMLSLSESLSDAVITAHLDAHTRYPACEDGDPDRVVGYVNFKEMVYTLRTNPHDATMRGIVRPVRFISPEKSADELLKAFVDEHAHMAVVRDKQGQTLGLVTLEDLVEELVGELEDEFDRLPRMMHALSEKLWMFGGGVLVNEVNAKLGTALPEPNLTVSRWLLSRLSHPPRPGETYQAHDLTFTIRRVRRGKLFEVSVRR